MRPDKQQAIKLRLQGKSYSEITDVLGIPKSTLAGWLGKISLSDQARARIAVRVHEGSVRGLIKKNKLQTHLAERRAKKTRLVAKKEIGKLNQRDLFLTGIALYWGEGYKRPIMKDNKIRTYHPVKLTNSDPYLVKLFLRFLREICAVPNEKIIASVRIYKHHNESRLLEFWSRITNIEKRKFRKFYYGVSKSSLGKRPFNILPYGTIEINVNSTELYHRIMGWIEGLKQ